MLSNDSIYKIIVKNILLVGILVLPSIVGAQQSETISEEEQLRLLEEGDGNVEFDSALPGTEQKPAAKKSDLPVNIGGHVSARWGASAGNKDFKDNVISEDRMRLNLIASKENDRAGFYGSFSFFYFGRAASNTIGDEYNATTSRVLSELYDTDPERFQAALHQAYVSLYSKHADFRIGRQVIKWGAADAPTNTLNPNAMVSAPDQKNAFSGELEDSLLGVDAIKSNIYFGAFDLEAVLVPRFEPLELPAPNTYWGTAPQRSVFVPKTSVPLEGLVDGAEADDVLDVTKGRLKIPLDQVYIRNLTPSFSVKYLSGGLGIKRNLLGQDLALYYFHSQERIPISVTKAKIQGTLDTTTRKFTPSKIKTATVRLKYPNTDSFGFASAGSVWKLGYRFDINYLYQREFLLQEFTGIKAQVVDVPGFDDSNFDGDWDVTVRQKTIFLDQLAYAFGVNFNLFHNITMSIDYHGRQILGYKKDLVALERQDIIAPRIQDSFLRETLFLRLQYLLVFQSLDMLLRPEVEYRFTQAAQVFFGAVVLLGDKRRAESARDLNLGPIVNRDMVYFMGRYTF